MHGRVCQVVASLELRHHDARVPVGCDARRDRPQRVVGADDDRRWRGPVGRGCLHSVEVGKPERTGECYPDRENSCRPTSPAQSNPRSRLDTRSHRNRSSPRRGDCRSLHPIARKAQDDGRRSPRTSAVGDTDAGDEFGRCRHRDSSMDSTWVPGAAYARVEHAFDRTYGRDLPPGSDRKQPGAACRSNKCLRLVADRASVGTAERAGGCRAQEGRPTSAARRRLPAARP